MVISQTVPIEINAPVLLAQYFGEFEKENLDVEIITLPPNEAYLSLGQGTTAMHLDGVNAAFLNNKHQGNDLVWVAQIHHLPAASKEGLWVNKDLLDSSGNVDPENIPGMRIALGTGGVGVAGALPVAAWLEENGYSLNDIEPVALGGADGMIALENGQVDATYVITPFWLQLDNPDSCCVWIEAWPGGLSASVYVMSQGFIDDDGPVARAIFRAIARTTETYLQGDYHQDLPVMEALSEILGVPVDTLQASPSVVFDTDFDFDTVIVEQIQQIWIDVGGILNYDTPIPLDELLDGQVAQDMLAGL